MTSMPFWNLTPWTNGLPACVISTTNLLRAGSPSATEQERKEIELLLALIIRPVLPVLGGADADRRLLRRRGCSGNGGGLCGGRQRRCRPPVRHHGRHRQVGGGDDGIFADRRHATARPREVVRTPGGRGHRFVIDQHLRCHRI